MLKSIWCLFKFRKESEEIKKTRKFLKYMNQDLSRETNLLLVLRDAYFAPVIRPKVR